MTEEQTIAYPEWTKKGYREASEGDGLVMSRPFRARGTVQPQQSPTLTCTTGCGSGVVVKQTVPKDDEPALLIKEDTKKGYAEAREGDGIKLSQQPGMSRGVVQKGQVGTLVTWGSNSGYGVVVKDAREPEDDTDEDPSEALPDMEEGDVVAMLTPGRINKRQNGRRFKDDGSSFTITCQDIHGIASKESGRLRIRYLTPRECWRLMGFPDWAFDRAAEAGTTKTQLYKQAGNSIVVPVLQAIFEGMYQKDSWKSKRRTLDDFFGGE